jgi:hypothetical protein
VAKLLMTLLTIFFVFRDGAALLRELTQVLQRYFDDRLDPYIRAAGAMTRAVVFGILPRRRRLRRFQRAGARTAWRGDGTGFRRAGVWHFSGVGNSERRHGTGRSAMARHRSDGLGHHTGASGRCLSAMQRTCTFC